MSLNFLNQYKSNINMCWGYMIFLQVFLSNDPSNHYDATPKVATQMFSNTLGKIVTKIINIHGKQKLWLDIYEKTVLWIFELFTMHHKICVFKRFALALFSGSDREADVILGNAGEEPDIFTFMKRFRGS